MSVVRVVVSRRAVFRLTGADAVRYLNGQVTANVSKLAAGQVLPAIVPTAKGKVCALVFIALDGDAVRVDADFSVRESLAARLERYIVADDVAVEDVSDSLRLVHWLDAPPAMGATPLPTVRRVGPAGRDLWVAPDVVASVTAGTRALEDWEIAQLCVTHAVPRWGHEVDENTFPQEAGLDATHVDFHKGCYVGQEVISRLRSVGQVTRQLRGFICRELTPSHTPIFSAADASRPVGTITSAAVSYLDFDRRLALGYLRRGTDENGLVARTGNGAPDTPLEVCELPFLPPDTRS